MTQSFYTLLTTTGAAKIAAVQAGSAPPVQRTHIALGDGGGQAYDPTGSETALVNEVHRTTVTSVAVDSDNPSWVVVDAVIPPDVGGWWIREAGIFDSDGDMIAIAKMAETYKPVLTDGMATDLVIRLILQVASASAVTITVDPSQILATHDWVLTAYPWATDTEATDATITGKVMDPARTHLAIDSRLADATQAGDADDGTHLITPAALHAVAPSLVGSLPQAGVPAAICAADEAAALAAGLADGGLWLKSAAATPTVYRYNATAATSTALVPQPSCVWCTNTQRLWLRDASGVLRQQQAGMQAAQLSMRFAKGTNISYTPNARVPLSHLEYNDIDGLTFDAATALINIPAGRYYVSGHVGMLYSGSATTMGILLRNSADQSILLEGEQVWHYSWAHVPMHGVMQLPTLVAVEMWLYAYSIYATGYAIDAGYPGTDTILARLVLIKLGD